MNEILMIVNPKAGKAKPNKYVPKIIQNFNDKGYKIDVKYTEIKNNATKIIKNYNKDYKILIVYGGDGTLNEAIQGLYEINIKEYKLQKVDTGLVQNNIFNYVVSFGMFSKTSYATSRKMKNKFGRLAYILNGIKEVFKYKTYDLKIEAEEKSLEGNFIYGSISNSKFIGGFNLFKNENIKLDDGDFEAIFVKTPRNFYRKV